MKFYLQSCKAKAVPLNKKRDIKSFLTSRGWEFRAYVLDYNYKICGIMLKNNFFVPFFDDNRLDVFEVDSRDKFIYYDEIPRYRCSIAISDVRSILGDVAEYTKDRRYTVSHIIKGVAGSNAPVQGILINDSSVVHNSMVLSIL